ncbi:MAG: ATP-binding protein [Eubacterium sp.]
MRLNIDRLILYKNFKHNDLFYNMADIFDCCIKKEFDESCEKEEVVFVLYECVNELIELSDAYGLEGNLWHSFLAFLIANNENAYSTACEITGKAEGSINNFAINDFTIFKQLFEYDITLVDKALDVNCMQMLTNYTHSNGNSRVFNKRIRDSICQLGSDLENARNVEQFKDIVTAFYGKCGVGKFGLNKAFRLAVTNTASGEKADIVPITGIEHIYLNDLVGYELQKQKLIDNTEAFINGKAANNVLLYGDSGTGKSSSIKAILNEYYDRGLRMIEVYKHQFNQLSAIIETIKDRNYKFIIYMDDLSFEDYEIEYKYLKAIIEGGLGKKPENVLIYATSNRRHLIRETWSDKDDKNEELHKSDTVSEKLSLVARFGVSICYVAPDKKEYNNIVQVLAQRYGLVIPKEELYLEANKWELSHGGLSGRTAQQFINHLLGQQ